MEETHSWSKNKESLISMLSSTIKLSDFSLSPEGVLTVTEGRDPFEELFKDIQSIPEKSRNKAFAQANEVVMGAMTNSIWKTTKSGRSLEAESHTPTKR